MQIITYLVVFTMLLSCTYDSKSKDSEYYDILTKSVSIIENDILILPYPPVKKDDEWTCEGAFFKLYDNITYHEKTLFTGVSKRVLENEYIPINNIDTLTYQLLIDKDYINTPKNINSTSSLQSDSNEEGGSCLILLENPIITELTAFVGTVRIGKNDYSESVLVFNRNSQSSKWRYSKRIQLGFN